MPFNTFLERFAIGIAAASGLLTTACITGMPTAICTALGVGLGAADVRFGSKADMCSAIGHVRFAPNSDIDCVFRNVSLGPEADIGSAIGLLWLRRQLRVVKSA